MGVFYFRQKTAYEVRISDGNSDGCSSDLAVRAAAPDIHIHAFSPLEVTHGASTLGMPLDDYLAQLKKAGLATLPGTAAEILDDEVRAIICPDKVTASEWIGVMRADRKSTRLNSSH